MATATDLSRASRNDGALAWKTTEATLLIVRRLRRTNFRDHCTAATFPDLAARSRSITARQPVLSAARCLNMQAVIAGMFGMSELHRRKASPVHICCASALKAKLGLDDSADTEAAKASTRGARRSERLKVAIMFDSHWHRSLRARFVMTRPCTEADAANVMTVTSRAIRVTSVTVGRFSGDRWQNRFLF